MVVIRARKSVALDAAFAWCRGRDLDCRHKDPAGGYLAEVHLAWCRGPVIDGFYHCGDGAYLGDDVLRLLLEWGLLEVFGVEVLEERIG
jgi:hypothetical protein